MEQITNAVISLVHGNPEYRDLLKRIVSLETSKNYNERELTCFKDGCNYKTKSIVEGLEHENTEGHFMSFYAVSWEWHEVRAHHTQIKRLIMEGVVALVAQTNKQKNYRLLSLDATKAGLSLDSDISSEKALMGEQNLDNLKDSLFTEIVGHDDVKQVLKDLLASSEPVHCLLYGSPATAKTVFLLDVSDFVPGAQYILGGATSKAGLMSFLINNQPEILLIDELEKMTRDDLTALLSVMETGILRQIKYGRNSTTIVLKVKIIAAANEAWRLPRELISRFQPFIFSFKDYTPAELLNVATQLLIQRGTDKELAGYIATRLMEAGVTDIRGFVNLRKIAHTKEAVDRYTEILKRRKEE